MHNMYAFSMRLPILSSRRLYCHPRRLYCHPRAGGDPQSETAMDSAPSREGQIFFICEYWFYTLPLPRPLTTCPLPCAAVSYRHVRKRTRTIIHRPRQRQNYRRIRIGNARSGPRVQGADLSIPKTGNPGPWRTGISQKARHNRYRTRSSMEHAKQLR